MKLLKYGFVVASLCFLIGATFMSCISGGKFQSITITPENAFIATGTAQQFTATAIFSDGTTLNWTSATTWSSDKTEVEFQNQIGSFGLADSLSNENAPAGAVIITAIDTATNISSTATLSIVDPILISVKPENPSITKSSTQQFEAIADLFSDGNTTITQNVASFATWSSTNPDVATISSTGLATPVSEGTTTITATYSFVSSSATTTRENSTTLTITN